MHETCPNTKARNKKIECQVIDYKISSTSTCNLNMLLAIL